MPKAAKETLNIEYEDACGELKLLMHKVMTVINDAIYKLKVLKNFPYVLANEREIIKKHLSKSQADFVIFVCEESAFSRQMIEERSDLLLISHKLDRINIYERKGSMKKNKSFEQADFYELHVAFAVDTILKSEPLIQHLLAIDEDEEKSPEPLVASFLDTFLKLRDMFLEKLQSTAQEELKRQNDLKTSYRSSMMLSDNIAELEEQLERQREELGNELDRKQTIVEDLKEKLSALQEKSKTELYNLVYDSEVKMQKDWNKSNELQVDLAEKAKASTDQFDALLHEHLNEEKFWRAKRLKTESQLASWVAKYDQDMGEKFAELEALNQTFDEGQEKYEKLMKEFEEQEKVYMVLMEEKEEEERRINEEIMWKFLQNSSARKIQKCWRAYRARKLARRKKKKGKKKGKAGGKKGKKIPKDKGEQLTLKGGPDPNALIDSKFKTDLLADIENKEEWAKKDVVVDL